MKNKFDFSFTNPNKVLYQNQGITKIELGQYYYAVSEWMLPYVVKRPLTLVRCPSGHHQKCFYQKHLSEDLPAHIYPIPIKESKAIEEYLYIKDVSGLLTLVQLGVLEIHPWEALVDNVEKPDVIIFDLDPGPEVDWSRVVNTAHYIREVLADIKLQSFVKTTGGKGLHVVIPIKRLYTWEEVKNFTKAFVELLVEENPKEYVSNMAKSKRIGRIYLDFLRNQRGATAIAPYSTRARDNAPCAMPISWDSLTEKLDPQAFTVRTLPSILARLRKDPWEGYFKLKQKLILPS